MCRLLCGKQNCMGEGEYMRTSEGWIRAEQPEGWEKQLNLAGAW